MSPRPRKPNAKTKRLELRLEPELLERLAGAAGIVEEPVSEFVRKAILDRLESIVASPSSS